MPQPYAYQFNKNAVDDILVDAYERIGLVPDELTPTHIEAAKRSANLLLSEWSNRGFNLWSLSTRCLPLLPNRKVYPLFFGTNAVPVNDIHVMTLRQSMRKLVRDGVPFAGNTSEASGEAANAFDGDPDTVCIQGKAGGWIGYDFGEGNSQTIGMVGLLPDSDDSYTIAIQVSFDTGTSWNPDDAEWQTVQVINTVGKSRLLEWFDLEENQTVRAIRICDQGSSEDAPGLRMEEIYFNGDITDTPLARLSAQEYALQPRKFHPGKPNSYWFNRQAEPQISVWPVPNQTEETWCLWFSYIRQFKDINMVLQADTPSRFFEPLAAGIAFKLSVKLAPDRTAMLKQFYEESFERASQEDSEKAPLRIFAPQMASTWGE